VRAALRHLALSGSLTACAVLVGCAPSRPREIRVGLLALLKSEMANPSGIPSERGARMATDEINNAGGVEVGGKRYRINLIVRDYEPRPDAAASAARALINLDSVDVLIGPQFSSDAIAASTVAEDAHIPMIAPMASNPAVPSGKKYIYRVAFLYPFMGEMLARYAEEDLKAKRAAVLYDVANAYGRDISELFRSTFEKLGGKVVASETFTTDQKTDFTAQLRRIAAANPDVLLLPNVVAVDSFQVRQARALGIKAAFLASDIWDPPGMRHIPESHGTVYARQWHPDMARPATQQFTNRFRELFHEEARSTAAMTYDAVKIAMAAITRAGSFDGTKVGFAIGETKGYDGVTGTLSFDGSGDPRRTGVLAIIGAERDSIIRLVDPRP